MFHATSTHHGSFRALRRLVHALVHVASGEIRCRGARYPTPSRASAFVARPRCCCSCALSASRHARIHRTQETQTPETGRAKSRARVHPTAHRATLVCDLAQMCLSLRSLGTKLATRCYSLTSSLKADVYVGPGKPSSSKPSSPPLRAGSSSAMAASGDLLRL